MKKMKLHDVMFLPIRFNLLLLITAVVLGTAQANAYPSHQGEYIFWSQMPEAAQVTEDLNRDGANIARQHAAFVLLIGLVNVSADGRKVLPWPKRERELNKQYYQALPSLHGHIDTEHMFAQSLRFQGDESFTRPFLKRYFTEAATAEIMPFIESMEKSAQLKRMRTGGPAQASVITHRASTLIAAKLGMSSKLLMNLVFGLLCALLLLAVIREMRRFGLDKANPFTVRSGWGSYDLHSITGEVLSPTKERVITSHTSGGGSYVSNGMVHHQPISTSTTESVHEQFFIRDSQGREEGFQLRNVDIALREGHNLSALWAIKKGKERGPYILFHNHSISESIFMDKTLKKMLKPHKWPVLPLILITVLTWDSWGSELVSTMIPNNYMTQVNWMISTVLVFILFFIFRGMVKGIRMRRLKRQMTRQLLPTLHLRSTV